jgi:hypothetical protein
MVCMKILVRRVSSLAALAVLSVVLGASVAQARDHGDDGRDGGRGERHERHYDGGRGRDWDHHDRDRGRYGRGHWDRPYWRNNRSFGIGFGNPWIWGYNPRPRVIEREVIREVPVYVPQPTYYQQPIYSQPVYSQPISYAPPATRLPNGGQFSGDWYQDANNRQCREYTTQGMIGGMRQQIYGTACYDGQNWAFNR